MSLLAASISSRCLETQRKHRGPSASAGRVAYRPPITPHFSIGFGVRNSWEVELHPSPGVVYPRPPPGIISAIPPFIFVVIHRAREPAVPFVTSFSMGSR